MLWALMAFRLWWDERKLYVEWSPERQQFVLRPDALQARVPAARWAAMTEQDGETLKEWREEYRQEYLKKKVAEEDQEDEKRRRGKRGARV